MWKSGSLLDCAKSEDFNEFHPDSGAGLVFQALRGAL